MLARDVFPAEPSCLTCYFGIQEELTRRIAYLERKASGRDAEFRSPFERGRRSTDDQPGEYSWRALGE